VNILCSRPLHLRHNATRSMTPLPRHQCLIYEGPPSRHLAMLAMILRQKLQQNFRCLYLNSIPMVASMRSCLAAAGVDIAQEVESGNLELTSDRQHLIDGTHFDAERLMQMLEDALNQALVDGYAGLWATGDMTWEFGPEKDFSKLLDYEWRLEEFFRTHAQIGGICQYHADTLPRTAVREGLQAHRGLFVTETLSLLNPHYCAPENFPPAAGSELEVDAFLDRLCSAGPAH